MDEDFLDVTENSHKVGIIFMLAIVTIAVCGYFFVFKKIYFSVRTLEVELGSEVSTEVRDYFSKSIKDASEFKLDVSKVNTSEVGEYAYTITHNGSSRKGKIKVVDTTPPEFTLKEVTVEEGMGDLYLGEFLDTCEDYSKPCIVTLKNSKDDEKFKNVGRYTIEIEVADTYGNKKRAQATLNVVAVGSIIDSKAKDLTYAYNSENIENFKGPVYMKLDKGIPSGSDEESDLLTEVSIVDLEKFVRENYESSSIKETTIIKLYNKSSYTIGFSIQIKLSDGRVVYVPEKWGLTSSEE